MRISRQLIPPGGWQFRQDSTFIKEQTFDDLVKTVTRHREANNIRVGNVEADVEDQIADANPEIVINGDKKKDKFMGVQYFQTVQSFVQSLWNYTIGGNPLVDQNTANIRAEICAGCHNNVKTSETAGCSSCNKAGNYAINLVRAGIIKDRRTTADERLKACALCGCDLKVKVWFPLSALGQTVEEANAWPTFCWRKKILENAEV